LRVANDGIVEELGFSRFLGKTHFMGNVFGNEQKPDGLTLVVVPWRNHDPRADAPVVLAHSSEDAFPLPVFERRLHDFAGFPAGYVNGNAPRRGLRASMGICATEWLRRLYPSL
jgi:hypothetical protein